MSEETADLLASTREYIEEHGWTQHMMVTHDGRVCSVGGMTRVLGVRDANCIRPEVVAACEAIVGVVGKRDHLAHCCGLVHSDNRTWNQVHEVTYWNDYVAVNQQQVLDALAKAEKIERAGFDPDA